METGFIRKVSSPERTSVPEAQVAAAREAFQQSPTKFIRRTSRKFKIPQSTIHKVVRKSLKVYPYKSSTNYVGREQGKTNDLCPEYVE